MSALTVTAFLALAPACGVAPAEVPMLAAIVATESSFHPYSVHVNEAGRSVASRRFGSVQEATAYVDALIAQGVTNIDMGATQLNLRAGHLQKRGLPPSAAFDPCTAARIGIEVLAECFGRAPAVLPEQDRLDASLHCYNSGRFTPNGYADRVRVNFERRILPALRARNTLATEEAPSLPSPPAATATPTQRPTATVLRPGTGRELTFNR
ncbi:transglycosylase SLT domain-containing protein [Muricoccus nepalensis]|uniref:transglycosylase SLT domain-containing protein n=1 Tax=Muricoccus nepalensis TaxID=1854500 RepID=UPI001386793E|nr:transglycosylase SLT domain-containing protein [Roseomonas nepalensis]